MCACGTSNPITVIPQRLHGKAFSIAFAIGCAKMSIWERCSGEDRTACLLPFWEQPIHARAAVETHQEKQEKVRLLLSCSWKFLR